MRGSIRLGADYSAQCHSSTDNLRRFNKPPMYHALGTNQHAPHHSRGITHASDTLETPLQVLEVMSMLVDSGME